MFRSTGNEAINVDKNIRSVFKVDKESGELKFRKFPIFTNVMNVQCCIIFPQMLSVKRKGIKVDT